MRNQNTAKRCIHHWPTRSLCVLTVLVQSASLNWYLMDNLSYHWAAMYAADAVVIGLFIMAFLMAASNDNKEKHIDNLTVSDLKHLPMMYISWFVYAVVLDVKVIVIFLKFSTDLEEVFFFGPNTLKTTLALSALVFLTFLATQHDVKSGTRKTVVVALTATIMFDVLDGVDILDNLFEKDIRDSYPPDLDDAIIAIFCVNFLLPTIPLLILAKTRFVLNPLPERLELFHKFALAYLVNLPLFIIRMLTWHGLSQGISIFLLKNIIAMGIVTFEMFEHFCCTEAEEIEDVEMEMKA